MTVTLTEFRHSGGFLVSEANGARSRDTATYTNAGGSDVLLQAGTVLALAAEGADAVVAPGGAGTNGANTGGGSLASLTFDPAAKVGVYAVKLTSATAFTVVDPAGAELATGVVGTPYLDAQLGFTVAASGAAFVAGDGFTVTVPSADNRYVNWTNGAPAAAIAYSSNWIVAGTTQKVTVVSRDAEVNASELEWDPSITNSVSPTPAALQAIAMQQLTKNMIIAR
jgi:hypothetical protein